jgi:ABC-type branched-subunit amino acid transport system ATPase component
MASSHIDVSCCQINFVGDCVAEAADPCIDATGRRPKHDPVLLLIDEATAGIGPRVATPDPRADRTDRRTDKAILPADQNIKRALEIAEYVYVMRTDTILTEGSREVFGGDTDALIEQHRPFGVT